jgi:hypothetical protein
MINWPSIEEKLRAIGFLSIPGVISAIEATVPKAMQVGVFATRQQRSVRSG